MKAKLRRPKCRQCGKPLAADYEHTPVRVEGEYGFRTDWQRGKLRGYGYMGRGHFCSLRCGWRFAIDTVEGNR